MQLTVPDVARMFRVHESAVYRWIGEKDLPARRVNGQFRLNRTELLEWATHHKEAVSPAVAAVPGGNGHGQPCLERALRTGGIFYQVKGAGQESVLRAVVRSMPLPADFDRDFLLQVLLHRESLGSTNLGDGLALPHPRYPVVVPVPQPFITLSFLDQPIRYGPAEVPPVHTLFALVSPNVRDHLGLLARLGHALRDPAFRDLVVHQGHPEEILAHAGRLDEAAARDYYTEAS